ncbi:unnamed protein product [Larinioides sclopetarius]|uniref:Spidroin N-terminal domain-containing protein n=1 Tax=Larinioides sclopetarius TaxID=280406 RepID=A0AAV1ZA18_9ARAC
MGWLSHVFLLIFLTGIYFETVWSDQSYYEYSESESGQDYSGQDSENEPGQSYPQQNGDRLDSENAPDRSYPHQIGNRPGQSYPLQNGNSQGSENEPSPNYPQQNDNRPGQNSPQQIGNQPDQDYPPQNSNRPGQNYPQQSGNSPDQSYPQQNGNNPDQSYPQQNGNNQGSENEPSQNYPQQNGNGPDESYPQQNDNRPRQNSPQQNGNQPDEDYPQQNSNKPGQNYPQQSDNSPDQSYPQQNSNGPNLENEPGQNSPQQNGNKPGLSEPQQNSNGPDQNNPQHNGSRQGLKDDPNDPLGFNELGDKFVKIFIQNVVENPNFGKGADTDFTEVTYALKDAMNLLRQAHHAPPEQKRTIMIAFSATIAELIVIECRDDLAVFEKVRIVTNALKTAYIQTTGRINYPLINEVTFLVIIFLEETSQKPPKNIHQMFPGFPGLIFLPRTFQPRFTYDPRLISYIYGYPEDFISNIPTKHGIPQEEVPGQNYTIYFPFLRRFIEEFESIYPLYPYHRMPQSEYELLFPELYRLKPQKYNFTIFRPGTNPYKVIHKHIRKVRHKHYRKVRNPHYRPGEPKYE